jgi:hypothetical protein
MIAIHVGASAWLGDVILFRASNHSESELKRRARSRFMTS